MKRGWYQQIIVCCFLCQSWAAVVKQEKKLIIVNENESVEMPCYQDDSTFFNMLWYQQKPGGGLKLVVSSTATNDYTKEKDYEKKSLELERSDIHNSVLKLKSVTKEDEAVYFCAASGNTKLEFGVGTILSVLGNGEVQKNPKVKIFPPNKREFQDHSLISLVCVATGFFPEHVRLTWFVNDVLKEDVYQNVPTKNEDGTYSTSKRLSLTKSEYFNPDSTFKCKAGFIGDEPVSDEIKGESDCGVSKEHFTMIINQGKISYIMVLFKSGLYALIVLAIIWRKKVLSGSC